MALAPRALRSPCVNVCQMHAGHGHCIGCFRSLDEIARWSAMSDAERVRVLRDLPGRRSRLKGAKRAAP